MQNKPSSKITNKLRSSAGESIAETLVALLISALALVMLAGVIAASSRIVNSERSKLNTYYEKNEKIVKLNSELQGPVNITIKVTEKDNSTTTVGTESVKYYKNDAFTNKPVIAYKRAE